MDRRTQLTEVVEVAGRLVGEIADAIAESRASPALLGQPTPANSRHEAGVLLYHRLHGVGSEGAFASLPKDPV